MSIRTRSEVFQLVPSSSLSEPLFLYFLMSSPLLFLALVLLLFVLLLQFEFQFSSTFQIFSCLLCLEHACLISHFAHLLILSVLFASLLLPVSFFPVAYLSHSLVLCFSLYCLTLALSFRFQAVSTRTCTSRPFRWVCRISGPPSSRPTPRPTRSSVM